MLWICASMACSEEKEGKGQRMERCRERKKEERGREKERGGVSLSIGIK